MAIQGSAKELEIPAGTHKAIGRALGGAGTGSAARELKEKKARKFGVVEQIGLAADMLPGGAILSEGVVRGAAGGMNFLRMIDDAHTAYSSKGYKGVKETVLKWASIYDESIIVKTLDYLEGLKGKVSSTPSLKAINKAVDEVYVDLFFGPKAGLRSPSIPGSAEPVMSKAAKKALGEAKIEYPHGKSVWKEDSALEYIQRQRNKPFSDVGTGIGAKQEEGLINTMFLSLEKGQKTEADIARDIFSVTDGDPISIQSLIRNNQQFLPTDTTGIHKKIDLLLKNALQNPRNLPAPQNLTPARNRLNIPPSAGSRLNLPGGPIPPQR
jgi:hypothetical protein